MYKNVLLVDTLVKNYNLFIDSVNTDTLPVVYSRKTTKQEILSKLPEKFERICVVSYNKTYLENESLLSKNNTDFMISIIETYKIKNIDYLACNTLLDTKWKNYYSRLPAIVGASNDETGNIKYGGDWIMESTSQDIEFIYFTKNIEYYEYLLDNDFEYFSSIVKKDGINTSGPIEAKFVEVKNISDVKKIVFGIITEPIYYITNLYCFALKNDGSLYASGDNTLGQLGLPYLSYSTFRKVNIQGSVADVVSKNTSSFILLQNGTLYASGDNTLGQLGLDTVTTTTTFQEVTITKQPIDNSSIKQIIQSSDGHRAFILLENGSLYASGDNSSGQLGLGELTSAKTFQKVVIGVVTQLENTDNGAIVLSNNKIYVTGSNSNGELGAGTATIIYTFQEVTIDSNNLIVQIQSSGDTTCILLENGSIYGTGNNSVNLSLPYSNYRTFTRLNTDSLPIKNMELSNLILSTIINGTIYICSDAPIMYKSYYQHAFTNASYLTRTKKYCLFNDGTIQTSFGDPISTIYAFEQNYQYMPVEMADKVKIIRENINYAYALLEDGTLWSCGRYTVGRLGLGLLTSNVNSFQQVNINKIGLDIFSPIADVIVGINNGMVLLKNGSLYAAGANDVGQLGLGPNNQQVWTFTKVNIGPIKMIHNSIYIYNTLVVLEDGSLYATGYNLYGELGVGTNSPVYTFQPVTIDNDSPISQIKVTDFNSGNGTSAGFVLLENDTLYASGGNESGRLGLGTVTNTTTFQRVTINRDIIDKGSPILKIITANSPSTFLLLKNGSVYATGDNTFGQLGLPNQTYNTFTKVNISNVIDMYTKDSISYALLDNGSLYATGINTYGQLGLDSADNGAITNDLIINYGVTNIYTTFTYVTNGVFSLNKSLPKPVQNGDIVTSIDFGTFTNNTIRSNIQLTFFETYLTSGSLPDRTFVQMNLPPKSAFKSVDNSYSTFTDILAIVSSPNMEIVLSALPYNKNRLFLLAKQVILTDNDKKVTIDSNNTTILVNNKPVSVGTPIVVGNYKVTPIFRGSVGITVDYVPTSAICFPAGTPVLTDQGYIPIDKITTQTLGKKPIKLTKTITRDNYLVCVEKDALEKNVPFQRTYISKDHKVYHKDFSGKAKDMVPYFEKVYKVPYNGEILYNVLVDSHRKMKVNNMVCETLNPIHPMAKLYNLNKKEQEDKIVLWEKEKKSKKQLILYK